MWQFVAAAALGAIGASRDRARQRKEQARYDAQMKALRVKMHGYTDKAYLGLGLDQMALLGAQQKGELASGAGAQTKSGKNLSRYGFLQLGRLQKEARRQEAEDRRAIESETTTIQEPSGSTSGAAIANMISMAKSMYDMGNTGDTTTGTEAMPPGGGPATGGTQTVEGLTKPVSSGFATSEALRDAEPLMGPTKEAYRPSAQSERLANIIEARKKAAAERKARKSGKGLKPRTVPGVTTTPSGPEEGDTKMFDGVKHVWENGAWVPVVADIDEADEDDDEQGQEQME